MSAKRGMEMNIVFLDFDGVINTPIWEYDEDGKLHCCFHYPFDKDCTANNFQAICWLNEYCKITSSHIVVSSTWRYGGLKLMQDCLYRSGLNKNIMVLGVTDVLHNRYGRGEEIYTYLINHPEIEKLTILDDDSDMGNLEKYLIKCNCNVGFLINEFNKAKMMFDNQPINDWKKIDNYVFNDEIVPISKNRQKVKKHIKVNE